MTDYRFEFTESPFSLSCWLQRGGKAIVSKHFHKKGYTISEEQWRVLVCLWNRDGQTQSELMKTLRQHRSGVSRIVSSLVDDNLAVSVPDQLDKRSKRVFLTSHGKELKKGIMHEVRTLERTMLSGIDPDELETCKKVMRKIIKNLGGVETIACEINEPLLNKE